MLPKGAKTMATTSLEPELIKPPFKCPKLPSKEILDLILKCEAIATDNGFLIGYEPKPKSIKENNLGYTVCLAENLANKPIANKNPKNDKKKAFDPFAGPFKAGAHIFNLGQNYEYRLILNKYPCMPHHTLLISTDYIQQTLPLSESDFEIASKIFGSFLLDPVNCRNPLLFFNSGIHSGATQMHRHLHFIPGTGQTLLLNEIAKTLKSKRTEEKSDANESVEIQMFDGYPFLHGVVLLNEDMNIDGSKLYKCYQGLLKMLKDKMRVTEKDEVCYNMLMTQNILMVVPRKCGVFEGILDSNEEGDAKCSYSVNALPFAGLVFCNSEKQMLLVEKYGITKMLKHCTFPVDIK